MGEKSIKTKYKTNLFNSYETNVECSETTDSNTEKETQDLTNKATKRKPEIKTEPNIQRTDPLRISEVIVQSSEIASAKLQNLDRKINSLMVKGLKTLSNGNKVYLCKVCGKEAQCSNMKSHIKLYHIDRASK